MPLPRGPIAQLDRVAAFEADGWGFDSLWGRHTQQPSGMNAPIEPEEPEETPQERRNTNIMLVVFFVLLVGGGIWLVDKMLDMKKIQDCVSAGRRNCAPIAVPDR
jgi:hypothetical protein